VLTTAPPRLFFWLMGHRCFLSIRVREGRGGVGRAWVRVIGWWRFGKVAGRVIV
jgi:hypothetical protein